MDTLLRTVHGSRLYGLAHADSDRDAYVVVADRSRARQHLRGKDDWLVLGLDHFLSQCAKGVPQALEAMFSPVAESGPLDSFRAGYRVGEPAFRRTYLRTIKSFALAGVEHDDAKRRRHALRLMLNLDEGLRTGRFNPRLTHRQADWVRTTAADPGFDFYHHHNLMEWP